MKHRYYDSEYQRYKMNRKFSDLSKLEKFGTIFIMAFFVLVLIFIILYAISLDTSSWPEIVSVEEVDSYPVSYEELMDGDLFSGTSGMSTLNYSNLKYLFKVTLSDGEEYLVYSRPDTTALRTHKGYIRLDSSFSVNRNADETADGESAVPVSLTVSVRQGEPGFFGDNGSTVSSFDTVIEKKVVNKIVESVTPVDNSPLIIYADAEYPDAIGKEFEITYADGTKTVAPVKLSTAPECGIFFELDGHPIDFNPYAEEGECFFTFLDYQGTVTATDEARPFSSIEITDCTVDKEYNVQSISYTLTKTDGTTESFTKDFYGGYYLFGLHIYDVFDIVDGYHIAVEKEFTYPKLFGDAQLNVTVSPDLFSDEAISDSMAAELPTVDDCSCICHRNMAYSKLCYRLYFYIQNTFSLDKTCKCGITHRSISDF